jgi:release factor glutamine methyltransferase
LLLHINEPCKGIKRFPHYFAKLGLGYPLQYVFNNAYFMGRRFYVDNRVLIPRGETETLVQLALKEINRLEAYLNTQPFDKNLPLHIFDLGTGSGNIAISLALETNNHHYIYASDISSAALEVAHKNVKTYNANVSLLQGDVFFFLDNRFSICMFDIVIANLPYVKDVADLDENVAKYEPHLALLAADDGLEHIKKVIMQCWFYQEAGPAVVLLEIAPHQVPILDDILNNKTDFNKCDYIRGKRNTYKYEFLPDIHGQLRFLRLYRSEIRYAYNFIMPVDLEGYEEDDSDEDIYPHELKKESKWSTPYSNVLNMTRNSLIRTTDKEDLEPIVLRKLKDVIFAVPTETVYGFAVNAFNRKAVTRLRTLKGRDGSKPFSLLLSNTNEIKKYAKVDRKTQKVIDAFLPGPLTIVLPVINTKLVYQGPTIGIRVSSYEELVAIEKLLKFPCYLTSANRAGEKPAPDILSMENKYLNEVYGTFGPWPISNPWEPSFSGVPTTVISILHGEVKLIRQGEVKFEDILAVYNKE